MPKRLGSFSRLCMRICALNAAVLLAASLASCVAPTPTTESILYSFCAQNCNGGTPTDGVGPTADLIIDKAGNLFGTTSVGGYKAGTVFQLSPNQQRTAWSETVIHAFCAGGENNCPDGRGASSRLVMDAAGNLYGTAQAAGVNDRGVVFRLSPNANGAGWTETVLYSFCPQANCSDGAGPLAGLIMDKAGNLYGTTAWGGLYRPTAFNGVAGSGVVFELTPNADKSAWRETVLYKFCALPGCADGAGPLAGLVMDADGRLYGTTAWGGSAEGGAGVAFMLTPRTGGAGWEETVLHTFCQQPNCPDGSSPHAGLVLDNAGNLYGTTEWGGGGALSGGAVFRLSPGQGGASWNETVLHSFCGEKTCDDGDGPVAGLLRDGAGNLYGTTSAGGNGSSSCCGVVFKLSPNPTGAGWTETVLHRFSNAPSADGYDPKAGLIMDATGTLYGTTAEGGTTAIQGGLGTVYRLSP